MKRIISGRADPQHVIKIGHAQAPVVLVPPPRRPSFARDLGVVLFWLIIPALVVVVSAAAYVLAGG